MKKSKFLIAFAICVTLMGIFLTGCGSKKTIDLSQYIVFEENGYDGYGSVTASFDKNKFEKDFAKVKVSNTKNSEYKMAKALGASDVQILEEMFTGHLDKDSELNNNDIVTYKIDVDNSFNDIFKKYKIENTEVTYTINNLKAVEKFNPFDEININFYGDNNDRHFTILKPDTDMWNDINYTIQKNNSIKAGDTIELSLNITDFNAFIEKYKKAPTEMKKSYTVPSFEKYISDIKEIDDKSIEKFKNIAIRQITTNIEKGSSIYVGLAKNPKLEYVGSYLANSKSGTPSVHGNYERVINKCYLVFKVSCEIKSNNVSYGNVEYYMTYNFSNLEKENSGEVNAQSLGISGYTLNFGISNLPSDIRGFGYNSLEEVNTAITNENTNTYLRDDIDLTKNF